MGILTRYLIRAHAGPFLFSVSALTGLVFLNAIAQRVESLAGKGLGWDVILDFLKLTLPHTFALTLPMAVLVAVLYAFSELAANNEITAMKAGGIRMQRLMLPMLGMGVAIGGYLLWFNDKVLPESNHALKNLLTDVQQKTPTFLLKEQVVNQIPLPNAGQKVYLQAARIDNARGALYEVVLTDPNTPPYFRTTAADSGLMMFNAEHTDLYLVLFDGVDVQSVLDPPEGFRQVHFEKQVVPLRGIAKELERSMAADRSDREMSIDTLLAYAAVRRADAEHTRDANLELSKNAVRYALGYPVNVPEVFNGMDFIPAPSLPMSIDPANPTPIHTPEAVTDHDLRRLANQTHTNRDQVGFIEVSRAHYIVEVYKKYALAVACIVFVLLGAPLAIRFPRGGLGMVIAVSAGIFSVYYVGLTMGEDLADAGRLSPVIAMWTTNAVFGFLALILLARMGRESGTLRGGGWDEILFKVREALLSPFRLLSRSRG
jgi:lipopolysaccharide export system permease protein